MRQVLVYYYTYINLIKLIILLEIKVDSIIEKSIQIYISIKIAEKMTDTVILRK